MTRWGRRVLAALLCALAIGLMGAAVASAADPRGKLPDASTVGRAGSDLGGLSGNRFPFYAAPSNDNIDSAASVPLGHRFFFSVADATEESGEPLGCSDTGNTESHTIWLAVTGTGGPIAVDTNLASDFDTMVTVYKASDGSFVDCNDDTYGNGASHVQFDSVSGATYLVQVGCSVSSGRCSLTAGSDDQLSVALIGNDKRAFAEGIQPGSPQTRTNIGADTDPSSSNPVGADTEPGETTNCKGTTYGATAWFSFSAPAVGTAAFTASVGSDGFSPVVAVYRGGDPTPIDCALAAPLAARVQIPVSPGTYLVQVGSQASSSGNFFGSTLTFQVDFAENTDRDGDGDANGSDCAPDDPTRAHGKPDIPGNGIDENCDGVDARPDQDNDGIFNDGPDKCPAENATGRDVNRDGCIDPTRLSVSPRLAFVPAGSGIKVVSLRIVVPAGAKLRVRFCFRNRCSKSLRTSRALASRTLRVKAVRNKRLRRGAKIRLWVTKSRSIGSYVEYRVVRGNIKRKARCLPVGSLTPKTRCSP